MKKIILYLTLGLCALCYSCADDDSQSIFPANDYLFPDSIAVNETLSPSGVYTNEYYMVFKSRGTDKWLYRYSIPEFIFMDTTFSKGEAPDEIGDPYMMKNNVNSESIWMYDSNRQALRRAHIGPEEIEMNYTMSRGEMASDVSPLRATVVNEKYAIFTQVDWAESRSKLYLCNISDSMRVLDSLYTVEVTEVVDMGEKGRAATTTNRVDVVIYGTRMMLVYPMIGMSQRYDITPEGRFEYIATIGEEFSYEELKEVDWKTCIENATYTKEAIAASDKYIFMKNLEYVRIKGGEGSSIKPTRLSLQVYDWDMNPIKDIDLAEKDAHQMEVDIYRNKVYAWDSKKVFDKVYVYDFTVEEEPLN